MRLRKQAFHQYFSAEDRVYLYLTTQLRPKKPALLIRYYIRYQTCVSGKWLDVTEYDNCHGVVHQHDYDRGGTKGPAKILGPDHDPKQMCKELQVRMVRLYQSHKEWYNHR